MSHNIAVAANKFAKGMDHASDVVEMAYSPIEIHDALSRNYPGDAHFVAYTIANAGRQPRINKGALLELSPEDRALITCSVLVADVDNEGHADWTPETREAARAQEVTTPALQTVGIYDTRSGRRLIQPLAAPIAVEHVEPYLARWLDTLEAQGVQVDKSCADWTRHFRLPNVVRDGNKYRSPYVNLSKMREISLDPIIASPRTVSAPVFRSDAPLSDRQEWARQYLEKTPEAIEGSHGEDRTWSVCCAVARGFDLSEDEALAAMSDWNARCQPPWNEDELRKKLARARAKNDGEPLGGRLERRVTSAPDAPAGFCDIDPRLLIREPGCDDVSPEEQQADIRRETEAARSSHDRPTKPKRARFNFQHGPDIVRKEITNPLWLVQGILPEAGVCVIAGEPKATKTWAMLEIGMALATGSRAFGEYEAKHRKNVVIFLAEDGERSLQARIAALSDSRSMDPCESVNNMWFQCRGRLNILDKEDMTELVAYCKTVPDLGLVALDPLRDLHNAEENDSTAMAKVTSALRWLRDEIGCSILFVHHAAKASENTASRRPGQRMRGSSVIHGAIDAGIYMSDTDTDLQSYWTNKVAVEIKEGAGAGVFSLTLNLNNDNDGRATGGSWVVEQVEGKSKAKSSGAREKVVAAMQAMSKPVGVKKLQEVTKQGQGTITAILNELREDGVATPAMNKSGLPIGWILTSKLAKNADPYHPYSTHTPDSEYGPAAQPIPPIPRPLRAGGRCGVWGGSDKSTADSEKPSMGYEYGSDAKPAGPRLTQDERERLAPLATPSEVEKVAKEAAQKLEETRAALDTDWGYDGSDGM